MKSHYATKERHAKRRVLTLLRPRLIFRADIQCDQIGRFITLWANFQSMWQQLFGPNCSHLGNFCKGVKILGNFYRHLATFYWSRCRHHTYLQIRFEPWNRYLFFPGKSSNKTKWTQTSSPWLKIMGRNVADAVRLHIFKYTLFILHGFTWDTLWPHHPHFSHILSQWIFKKWNRQFLKLS